MDAVTPGTILLACPEGELASRLDRDLSLGGWFVRRASSSAEAIGLGPAELMVAADLPDRYALLSAWRSNPATSGTPVLLLAADPDPHADSVLSVHTPGDVLRAQVLLLARLRRAERDSRAYRYRLEGILDHAPFAVSIKDDKGRYLLVNRSWELAFHHGRRDILGKLPHEIFPADLADRIMRNYQLAVRNGSPIEYEDTSEQPDGTHTYLESKFALRDDGQAWAVCGIATDITARKRAEQALRDSEALYSSLVETLPVCIFRKDTLGRFTYANTAFCAELNKRPEEILGQRDRDFYPSEQAAKYLNDDQQVIYRVQTLECIEEHTKPDGEIRYVHVIKAPVYDADRNVIGMQGIFWDVTERKQAQEELARTAVDIDIARRVQRRLFPAAESVFVRRARSAGFEVAGVSFPRDAVGGDYYDWFDLAGGLGVAVGDVAGHGTGPALLMAIARSYLYASVRSEGDPSVILRQVNEMVCKDIEGDRYITFLLTRLDPIRRTLRYASAGHATAYVLDGQNKIKHVLDSTGIPLGINRTAEFPASDELPLEAGDIVVLLTDGIAEARDPGRQTFGPERVLELVRVYRNSSAALLAANLYHAVRAFSQYLPQLDDITAVVVKVTGSSLPPPAAAASSGSANT